MFKIQLKICLMILKVAKNYKNKLYVIKEIAIFQKIIV